MADFHFWSFPEPATVFVALVIVVSGASVLLALDPGLEGCGVVEVCLEVAKDAGGCDAFGFVDGWFSLILVLFSVYFVDIYIRNTEKPLVDPCAGHSYPKWLRADTGSPAEKAHQRRVV
jgi:hypothetical protein